MNFFRTTLIFATIMTAGPSAQALELPGMNAPSVVSIETCKWDDSRKALWIRLQTSLLGKTAYFGVDTHGEEHVSSHSLGFKKILGVVNRVGAVVKGEARVARGARTVVHQCFNLIHETAVSSMDLQHIKPGDIVFAEDMEYLTKKAD